MSLELVIARFEEDLAWIPSIDLDITNTIVYNKGSEVVFPFPCEVKTLPNIGRETHTYLTHVVNNYSSLKDITFFVQGSAFTQEAKEDRVKAIVAHLKNKKSSAIVTTKNEELINRTKYFYINYWSCTNENNRAKNPDPTLSLCPDRPLGNWFSIHFPNEELQRVSFSGILAVTRQDILKRPLTFYQSLLDQLTDANPEVGHYIERVFTNIFSIDLENCIHDKHNP